MKRFQYASDLHLELFPGVRFSPDQVRARRLVLAGDIGDPASGEYAQFLAHCAANFATVFVVLGNHEAYGKSWSETTRLVREVARATNESVRREAAVVVLDREECDVQDDDDDDDEEEEEEREHGERRTGGKTTIRVLGCTLWSDIPATQKMYIRLCLTDFRRIRELKHQGVPAYNRMHHEDVAWLRERLCHAHETRTPCLVVTHHAPAIRGTSNPKYDGSPLTCAFATHLPDVVGHPAVAAWVHGHTHFSHRTEIPAPARDSGTVLLAANQRWYADDPEEAAGFDPSAVLALPG